LKFILEYWYLIVAALVSGGLLAWPLLSRGVASGSISTAEAVRLLNREKGVLIDVSEPAEYAAAHAAGARNVPFGQIQASKALPTNKALPLVVLCPTGTRARRAVAILKQLGFDNARVLAGGLAAWREANLPVERSA
jgi:rhodanese-related sulfurtransferase